jgi:hypothetical protein
MEYQACAEGAFGSPQPIALLPEDRTEWPEQARKAFHDVQRQLDRWCRQYDWPTSGNAWVAEEAVRRSW